MTGRYHNTSSVSHIITNLGWRDLAQRRVDGQVAMMFKITRCFADIPIAQYIKFHRNGILIEPIIARIQ